MQLFAIELRVVHRTKSDVLLNGCRLGDVSVDSWSGGHVQPLRTSNEFCIMHAHECGLNFRFEGCSGGAMSFVADDQVEFR